ncbi:hypothetical protein GBA52_014973 [Prunus armeniaca]|nr:hypothetical protein GBA52_014973 [Prunus armeniaca]
MEPFFFVLSKFYFLFEYLILQDHHRTTDASRSLANSPQFFAAAAPSYSSGPALAPCGRAR